MKTKTHVIGKVTFERGSVHLWWDWDEFGEQHDFSCLQDQFENAMDGGLENHLLNHGWIGLSISIEMSKDDGCPVVDRVWLDRPLEVEIEAWVVRYRGGMLDPEMDTAVMKLLSRAATELRELRIITDEVERLKHMGSMSIKDAMRNS